MGSSSRDPGRTRPSPTALQNSSRHGRANSARFKLQPTSTRCAVKAPTITRHPSRMIPLFTPDFVGSIASGAHYAGALGSPPPHSEHDHGKQKAHRRSLSMTADDPVVDQTYRDVMKDLEELFSGRPTIEILERRFRRDAVFEDSACRCVGFTEYASQFFALPKVFSDCERIHSRILLATFKPNKLVFSQTYEYTLRWFGTKKIVSSFVDVDLDDDFKIIRLVDQRNGEELPVRFGMLWLRKLNAKVTPWLIRIPRKSPSH